MIDVPLACRNENSPILGYPDLSYFSDNILKVMINDRQSICGVEAARGEEKYQAVKYMVRRISSFRIISKSMRLLGQSHVL